jgi:hypothetical protein
MFETTTLKSFVNMPPFTYTSFSNNVVATSSATGLVFTGLGNTDTLFLDDVSVVPAAVATPEPTSLALIGSALLAFAAVRRSKAMEQGPTLLIARPGPGRCRFAPRNGFQIVQPPLRRLCAAVARGGS